MYQHVEQKEKSVVNVKLKPKMSIYKCPTFVRNNTILVIITQRKGGH